MMDTRISFTDKDKILLFAEQVFFKEGFYKISMDEIARGLSMSKSTLYKHFPSKSDLINEAIFRLVADVKQKISGAIKMDANAVEKFVLVIHVLTDTITKFSDKWMSDMQNHAPHIWAKVDEARKKIMYENISKIILQGQKEGLIKNYPHEIIITLITGAMRNVVNPQFLISIDYSYNDAVVYAFKILLSGILTDKGQQVIKHLKLN
jgi:AcrR family transcriptional regulator